MAYITKRRNEPTRSIPKRLLASLLAGVTLLVLAAISYIIDPLFLTYTWYTRVDYGTLVHKLLTKETDSLHMSAYLFNITNAERFLSGEDNKLKVQEVGPFTYQEKRTNDELIIDREGGVMSYIPRYKINFLPEESIGNPQDMHIIVPNVAMLSMCSRLSPYSFIPKAAFNILANRLSSKPIISMTAQEYMWGYDEPLITLGNTFLPGWIDFPRLGLLDRFYDSNTTYRFVVSTKTNDKFAVKSMDGLKGLKKWGYDEPDKRSRCNSFADVYEGISYPPKLQPSRPLRIYRPALCRFMELDYVGPKHMDYGVDAVSYKISNRSYSKLPENECLCSNGICQSGVSDISPCFYGLPMVLSNGHFFGADPSVYNRIEGMTPNEEDHGSEFILEPYMGMVLYTKFSVQVNIMMTDVTFNSAVSKFSNMIVPIAQLKVAQPKLKAEQIDAIKSLRINGPYLVLVIQLVLILVGFTCLAYTVKILYNHFIRVPQKGVVYDLPTIEGLSEKDGQIIKPLFMEYQES